MVGALHRYLSLTADYGLARDAVEVVDGLA